MLTCQDDASTCHTASAEWTQNICCGIIEEEAVGESQFLNHVGSRRIGKSEVRHAESSAVLVYRPTAMLLSYSQDSVSATMQ